MKTVQVPQFDGRTIFTGYKYVKIKNKPDHTDMNRVTALLPGLPCGYVPPMRLINDRNVPVTSFYDARQGGLKKLKNFYVSIVN